MVLDGGLQDIILQEKEAGSSQFMIKKMKFKKYYVVVGGEIEIKEKKIGM